MTTENFIADLSSRIRDAYDKRSPLHIVGGNTRAFCGEAATGEPLNVGEYRGIIAYEPRELVITVRAGTTLRELEAAVATENQMLAFEPPSFAGASTIGGAIATGHSGPRRAYAGAARDFVLGTRIVNGRGEDLRFGGRVIKNVAGYDVSRLMVGAMGTLGVLTEISMKVMPRPFAEATRVFEMDEAAAIQRFNEWAGKPNPLSATAWHQGRAWVRLSGTEAGVASAITRLGGEAMDADEANAFWSAIRHQSHHHFNPTQSLWRISLPATTPPLHGLDGQALIEWGGALRWLTGTHHATALRQQASALGGHVTLMRAVNNDAPRFHPLSGKLAELNRNLKVAFDPADILNRGRMGQF